MKNSVNKCHQGFTLVELLVVIVIIGVLTAIAVPTYTGHVTRSHRADARVTLLQAAQFMQRFYAANDSFSANRAGSAVGAEIPAMLMQSPANGTAVYGLTVTATVSSYTLTMIPDAAGRMAADVCGSYILTSVGTRGNIKDGEALTAAQRDPCWK